MNNGELSNILEAFFPLLFTIMGWYMWSVRQKFITKEDFKRYKDEQQIIIKSLEKKIIAQSENMREIQVDIKHIAEAIKDIKKYIFKSKRRN